MHRLLLNPPPKQHYVCIGAPSPEKTPLGVFGGNNTPPFAIGGKKSKRSPIPPLCGAHSTQSVRKVPDDLENSCVWNPREKESPNSRFEKLGISPLQVCETRLTFKDPGFVLP